MAIVTDIDANLCDPNIENRIAQISWTEIKLLPKPGRYMWDVRYAILPEIRTIGPDHRRGIVINAFLLDLINRHDDDEMVLTRRLLHESNRRTVRNTLGKVIPAGLLFGAEIRSV